MDHVERDGVRLACAEYGGDGPPVMLLHGLAGYAGEWAETASWLTASHRVFAPDARGHGESERFPPDVSRAAHVADVELWLEHFGIEQAVLVGQSLGGHTAFLVAAHRPDLISGVIVAESTPAAGPRARADMKHWLESWPVPFRSREAALAFFGGDTLRGRAWVDGLEACADGLRSRFDDDVMLASLEEVVTRDYWQEWESVRCPALVVRAGNGVPRHLALWMIERQPNATLVEIDDAGHDLHLEQPGRWREAVQTFLLQEATS